MNTRDIEQERADFEEWYAQEYTNDPAPLRHGSEYFHRWDNRLFRAFQAGRAALKSQQPKVEFEDPRVQQVYEIICGDNHPPEGEHWDGYVSRLIVEALQSQDREEAQEIAATLATVLHFIPRSEEPELYDDVERLCAEFSDHARRIEGEW